MVGEVFLDLAAARRVVMIEDLRVFEHFTGVPQPHEFVLIDEQVVDAVRLVAPWLACRIRNREAELRVLRHHRVHERGLAGTRRCGEHE